MCMVHYNEQQQHQQRHVQLGPTAAATPPAPAPAPATSTTAAATTAVTLAHTYIATAAAVSATTVTSGAHISSRSSHVEASDHVKRDSGQRPHFLSTSAVLRCASTPADLVVKSWGN